LTKGAASNCLFAALAAGQLQWEEARMQHQQQQHVVSAAASIVQIVIHIYVAWLHMPLQQRYVQ
jgi:cytochrome b561